jgi:hypothetical protein
MREKISKPVSLHSISPTQRVRKKFSLDFLSTPTNHFYSKYFEKTFHSLANLLFFPGFVSLIYESVVSRMKKMVGERLLQHVHMYCYYWILGFFVY